MADVVLKRHCKLLSFFTIITLYRPYGRTVSDGGATGKSSSLTWVHSSLHLIDRHHFNMTEYDGRHTVDKSHKVSQNATHLKHV